MPIPTLTEIKNWSPEIEKAITKEWKQNPKTFDSKTKKKIYTIDTPPPYVNAPIHMGHAITYTYMDFFARYKRMKNFEVLFPLGLDRNGLPIELAAEKKFDVSPFHIGRDAFLKFCERLLSEASTESVDSLARLGISFSSYKQGNEIGDIYHTDAPEYRTLTQSTFLSLYKKNLIYEDKRISNWDPKLRSTIADSEIDYKEVPSTFNHIKFKVKETGEEIIIATTRPELICSCKMVIFNPEDERYSHLEGKTAITPIYGEEIPIEEHPFAQKDKGSGLVMMCSAGDITDIQFFREMNLQTRIAIDKDGTMNEHAGFLKGLSVREARKKIIEKLNEKKLIIKQEQITHKTPVSERSGAEIEFIEMPEFYLKQLEFIEDIRNKINEIKFFPEESKEILEKWLDIVSTDWPISRRRFYATPIPLWHSEEGHTAVPQSEKYYQPWKESPPKDSDVYKDGKKLGKVKDFPKINWIGEERVLDTWFDSSITELYITQYQKNADFFKKAFPVSLRPQGKEIIRTWLYYTLLRAYHETNKPAFENIWIHQHILDEKGRKMSKSLGNVIDPKSIIETEGTEALRFWSALEGDISKSDLLCSRERIKAEQKTINKLLNVTKFILQFKKPKTAKLTKTDEIFLEYIDYFTQRTEQDYEKYDFHTPTKKIREFIWETLASHYLELIKNRAYNEQKNFTEQESDSAKFTLHTIIERITILLHPIIPQITTIIANELKISFEKFPEISKDRKFNQINLIKELIEFNSEVWKKKKDNSLSLREPIKNIKIPKSLKPFEKDLIACHNLQ